MVRIVNLSYSYVRDFKDPLAWLSRIAFFTVIIKALSKHAEVHAIYHINYRGALTRDGVHYHFQPLGFWSKWMPWRFHNFVRQLRPDAVMVHGFIFPWQVWWLRIQLGAGVSILLVHHAERPYRGVRRWMQRKAYKWVNAFLFPSSGISEPWTEAGIVERGKVYEVFGSASIFRCADHNIARAAKGISGERNFLWVGRLDANKDPLCAISGFASVWKDHRDSRLYMIFQENELLDQCRQLARDLAIASEVIFVGPVSHAAMGEWYNSVNYIISSSHYEGSGIAVCEAMSCGCYPVLTDIPSFRMLTKNGELGLLYAPGDSKALGRQLVACLQVPVKELRAKILRHYEDHFSADAQARRIMQALAD
ncbi:MAG: glycosyltransferase family 4 protein [Bacteroidia bacterium]|nr:glycosyltransferase family 4 protein [Bacteroidia bacterium]